MKNLIYGLIAGIALTFFFIVLGGGKLILKTGTKSEDFRKSVIEKFEKAGEKATNKIDEIAK
ncbi:MAG TPA: hypothetical protein VII00_00375 [bacterium]